MTAWPPVLLRRLWCPGLRCVTGPLTRVMSHRVVEGCADRVRCFRHPQCGSQNPLPVTVAVPVGWLLCQGGLRARSVEGKAPESQGYELQWPSGKFSPALSEN